MAGNPTIRGTAAIRARRTFAELCRFAELYDAETGYRVPVEIARCERGARRGGVGVNQQC
ncbi:MAG: hypothetical protein ACRDRK_24720 [Pseudonocardia sp.]